VRRGPKPGKVASRRRLAPASDVPSAPIASKVGAERVVGFVETLRHTKGIHAGQPFTLAGWQRRDIIDPLFGTLLPDGRRQYRTAFVEIPRKNGKTQLAAAIALYLLFEDGEAGAEVYSAAADRAQARLVFGEAIRMLEASPELMAHKPFIYRDAIETRDGGVYRVLSADAPTKHGLNPSGVIIDELHAHQRRDLFDVLTTAQAVRAQPLTFAITTAGWDRTSVCWELHQYARQVRTGQRTDPTFLSVDYGADDDADWTDRAVWRAANPAMHGAGAFVDLAFLEAEYVKADAMPARQNAFRQLYLNQWVQQAHRWIDLRLWDQSAKHTTTEAAAAGRTAHGGLDLSAISDLTAWIMLLPCERDPDAWDVFARFFLPESALTRNRNADLYRQFQRDGWLTVTPGDCIDYRRVEAAIIADARRLRLAGLNIDARFQGIQVATTLSEHGIDVADMSQTHAGYAASVREFERLLQTGRIHHGGHPILRWMADNVVVRTDANGDAKPDRQRSAEKIDGICSLLMALDRAIRQPAPKASVYAERGVLVL
jgi:phage terminase large subunit-like protein